MARHHNVGLELDQVWHWYQGVEPTLKQSQTFEKQMAAIKVIRLCSRQLVVWNY